MPTAVSVVSTDESWLQGMLCRQVEILVPRDTECIFHPMCCHWSGGPNRQIHLPDHLLRKTRESPVQALKKYPPLENHDSLWPITL
jgi:hypothetical protein